METWTCHICGRERPDDKISIYQRPGQMANVPLTENIRYCKDNSECIEKAKTFSFFKKEGS